MSICYSKVQILQIHFLTLIGNLSLIRQNSTYALIHQVAINKFENWSSSFDYKIDNMLLKLALKE